MEKTVQFISYNYVSDSASVGIISPTVGFQRHDFTIDAFNKFLENPNLTGESLRIKQLFVNLGGTTWLKDQMQNYQKEMVNGSKLT